MPDHPELKNGPQDQSEIPKAELNELIKTLELAREVVDKVKESKKLSPQEKAERLKEAAKILRTDVIGIWLKIWEETCPSKKAKVQKAIAAVESEAKLYEQQAEEILKSANARQEVKKTIKTPIKIPFKGLVTTLGSFHLPEVKPAPTLTAEQVPTTKPTPTINTPSPSPETLPPSKLNFTPEEERRLKSYHEYSAKHFSDNNLNRTYPNRLQDHEFFMQAVMYPDGGNQDLRKVYKNYDEALPTIQSLHDELFPSPEYQPFFIDIGPGIANKDTTVMGGKGKPAITSQEMADRFPDMPVVALDLPDQVEIFMGRAQGEDNRKRKYTIDKKDREEMLKRENIHVLSGDGLKSLRTQWEDPSTNPIPERQRPQISSNHVLFIRAANSTDIYCAWEDNKKTIEQMGRDFPGNAIVLFFNKEIIYKKRNSLEWNIIGQVSDWGFNHNGRTLSRGGKPPFEFKKTIQASTKQAPAETKKEPSTQESAEIVSRFSKELEKLSEKMQNGDTGILIDGNDQNLFIVQKKNNNFNVIATYKVSTGKKGFKYGGGGGKTPLGLFRITEMPKGQVGQMIATGSTRKKVLKDLGGARDSGGKAVMMTAALHLEGEEIGKNDRYHDYRIHGTNYESRIGQPASGGCVRTKNSDILEIYKFAQAQRETGRELYVYITSRNPLEEVRRQYASK